MSKNQWKPKLKEIKQILQKIKEISKNIKSISDLKNSDSKSADSYKLNFKELSKVSKKIPSEVRKKRSQFPWKEIIELSKSIDKPPTTKKFEASWRSIQDNLPELEVEIDNISTKYNETAHDWKICPIGEYFVRGSQVDSYTTSAGKSVKEHLRTQHCREYSKHHNVNILSVSEVKAINEVFISKEFSNTKLKDLGYGSKGAMYDTRIAGWVKYWNNVLKPSTPLDPNFMKALIASESTFNPSANKNYNGKNKAQVGRGIAQVTPDTARILMGYRNELKDHFVDIDGSELYDPDLNLAAGVRWIYRKKDYAKSILRREATWLEAIEAYKGVLHKKKDSDVYEENMGPFFRILKKADNE